MVITFTLRGLGTFLLIAALIVLVVFLIVMAANLIKTLKHTNKVMDDVEVITAIARKRTEDVDQMVDGISGSVKGITSAFKGQETLIQALSAVAKAVTSVIGMLKHDSGSEEE
ncbi:MAG: hypothetical protein LKJ83_05030 [Eubacteriaceae bacterium]|jgi:uncharacterized protein YoxC|nr:hypothetical protein [Eubacteriaceae bacterium]